MDWYLGTVHFPFTIRFSSWHSCFSCDQSPVHLVSTQKGEFSKTCKVQLIICNHTRSLAYPP